MRSLSLVALCATLALLVPRLAWADTETVLILDNSGSMVTSARMDSALVPPADPDRLAVLGALILRELQGPGDRLHILNFDQAPPHVRHLPGDPASIRAMTYDAPTLFRGVLAEARRILSSSTADRRLLMLLTDGLPSDADFSVDEARRLLGMDQPPLPFDVVVFGLAADSSIQSAQDAFLVPLAGDGEFVRVGKPAELVTRFTDAFAATLGSRPETGTLRPGGSYTVDVGEYVTEVLVLSASLERAGPYAAELRRNGEPVAAGGSGDNGCSDRYDSPSNPRLCQAPFHHYVVWRAKNDPEAASRWTLSLDGSAKSEVAFGFILRYELAAELLAPPSTVRAGESVAARARITWRGQTFDAEDFFAADGFAARGGLGPREAPLQRAPDSTFSAALPAEEQGPQTLSAVFENRWMQLRAEATVQVQGSLPLELSVSPLDFGAWQGQGTAQEQCRPLLVGGLNADRVPLQLTIDAIPQGAALRIGGEELSAGDQVRLAEGASLSLCLRSLRCCGALAGEDFALRLRGEAERYRQGAVPVPIVVAVAPAGFWRCYKLPLLALLGLVLLAVIARGILGPRSFAPEQRLKVAGSERALDRASAMVLREQPGGRRGFYRHATVGLDASGTPLGPRSPAWLRLTAAGDGAIRVASEAPLEAKDRRTRQWQPVDASAEPAILRRRTEYRVGDLLFRIE